MLEVGTPLREMGQMEVVTSSGQPSSLLPVLRASGNEAVQGASSSSTVQKPAEPIASLVTAPAPTMG